MTYAIGSGGAAGQEKDLTQLLVVEHQQLYQDPLLDLYLHLLEVVDQVRHWRRCTRTFKI